MFKWMRNRSKPREILVETLIEFVRRSLLPSISSVVTKSLLYVGASLMAWPLIESIFLSGILKKFTGIDLGIAPPGPGSYIAGAVLMLAGAFYSYKVFSKTVHREIKIVDAKTSVLSSIWTLCNDAVKKSTGLVAYYPTQPKDVYKILNSALDSVENLMDTLKQHRPFILSESLYLEAMSIAERCHHECRMFGGYLNNIKSSKKVKDASFCPHRALKEAETEFRTIHSMNESFCISVREFINSLKI